MANNFEEQLIQRIAECSLVVDKLNNDSAWKIILRDLDSLLKQIDFNWQEIIDDKVLQKARTMKVAVMHLMNTKLNYENELKAAQEELVKMQSPETIIQKDADNEGVQNED